MQQYVQIGGLKVAEVLHRFVEQEVLPGTAISRDQFWSGLEQLSNTLAPVNRALLQKRDDLQLKIDQWHRSQVGEVWDHVEYKKFLQKIAYLVPQGDDFKITTQNVDKEIGQISGPQLVSPVMNERFALNAANARWGSLYDALYGTDMITDRAGLATGKIYNTQRGEAVIEQATQFLDQAVPLKNASHSQVNLYELTKDGLIMSLNEGGKTKLKDAAQFVGYQGQSSLQSVLLRRHGLHIEIQIDRTHIIGAQSLAGVKDVVLESAISTIQDCEDSVAAVDAQDKVRVYRNWLGLMKGDLTARFSKGGRTLSRALNPDRHYISAAGGELILPGRSLMLVRNVGHLMTSNAVLDKQGNELAEGILDALITSACALHDLNKKGVNANSQTGSIYIVKPKMHGPEEAAFANDLFDAVEDILGLDRNTLKIGLMDEERRTTVNLKACIRTVSQRLVFINTGFLDRTGDEIHTSMQAGAFLPKERIKTKPWIAAYENWNVDIGLKCGLQGHAQIGKGMWPMPDEMAQMMATKMAHPLAGANCAWVPSPTAATLHVMHYHQVDVHQQQTELAKRTVASLDDILNIPLLGDTSLSHAQVQDELNNNVQGLLGYVVRWIDQGVGCSKVPDINDVGLMEDRATLRISSQHLANWLLHGVCDRAQVMATLKAMARVVDKQNAADATYTNMAPDFEQSLAFKAACDLIFKGCNQPNGYTEPLLHAYRAKAKAK